MKLNTIYCESAFETMARMPDEFVQCVITSPPYYGLRSYKTEPQIWDNHNGCAHEWGESLKYVKQDNRSPELKASQGARAGNSVNSINWASNSGNFCQFCDAWRGELGLEPSFQLYIWHLIQIFAEVKRVLKKDGTCWVNLGDSYSGSPTGRFNGGSEIFKGRDLSGHSKSAEIDKSKSGVSPKSLMNIPARFAIAMTDELQFINRNLIIWHKPACMPSSAKDRFTVDFESIFFFAKNPKYKFNQQLEPYESEPSAPRDKATEKYNGTGLFSDGARDYYSQGGRNKRTVWSVNFEPQSDEHYASYPTALIVPMILAGTNEGDIVYDPFTGTATTQVVAHKLGRKWIGTELNPKYYEIACQRLEPIVAQSTLF